MKKALSLFMALATVISCFSGCGKQESQGPVTLTLVAEEGYDHFIDNLQNMVDFFYPEKQITIEAKYLPWDSEGGFVKRNTRLQQLRTEIMAGKGPDIFILSPWDVFRGSDGGMGEPLFTDVDEAMRNNVFLDLDDYIKDSEKLYLNEHIEIVMEAGRTEKGQMVLPILYSFPVELVETARLKNPDAQYGSLQEFLSCGDENLLMTVRGSCFNWIQNAWPSLADYDSGELTVTAEDIAAVYKDMSKLFTSSDGKSIAWDMAPRLSEEFLFDWQNSEGAATAVAIPNYTGGITANVTVYAAVNANTAHPQEAFNVIEGIYDYNIQNDRGYKQEGDSRRNLPGYCPQALDFFVAEGLATGKLAYHDDVLYDLDKLENLRANITSVRFTSELDVVLWQTWHDQLGTLFFNPESIDFDKLAQEALTEMKMILAE